MIRRARGTATTLAVALAALALASCGNRRELKPLAGADLPPPAYGQDYRSNSDDLLKRGVQAAPERSVELRKRSEDRQDDPFDLPPEH